MADLYWSEDKKNLTIGAALFSLSCCFLFNASIIRLFSNSLICHYRYVLVFLYL